MSKKDWFGLAILVLVMSLIGLVAINRDRIRVQETEAVNKEPVYVSIDGIFYEEDLLEALFKDTKPGDTIILDVSSYGGGAFNAFAFYNIIRNAVKSGRNVIANANGYVMSAAVFTWLAVPPENRRIEPYTTFLIHCSQLSADWETVTRWVNPDELEKIKQTLYRLDKMFFKLLAKNSNKDMFWWEEKLGHFYAEHEDFYLDGAEMKNLGFLEKQEEG